MELNVQFASSHGARTLCLGLIRLAKVYEVETLLRRRSLQSLDDIALRECPLFQNARSIPKLTNTRKARRREYRTLAPRPPAYQLKVLNPADHQEDRSTPC